MKAKSEKVKYTGTVNFKDPAKQAAVEEQLAEELGRSKARGMNVKDGAPPPPTMAAHKLTLSGDVRDVMLNEIKRGIQPSVWDNLNERTQEHIIGVVEKAAKQMVEKVVVVVAAQNFPATKATVKTVKNDGETIEIVAKVTAQDANRHRLFDAASETLVIVMADPTQFMGQRTKANADPDQKSIFSIIDN